MKSPNRENSRRWLHCGGRLIWMSAALSGFVLSAQAQIGSDEILQPIGGGGGSPFHARCPQSDVLTGVELWTGDQVDSIKPICTPAVAGQFQEYPSKFGGGGGVGPQQFVCPNDVPVVIAMKVASEPNGIVRHIHLYCGRAVATPQRAAFPLAVYDGPAYKWGTDCNIFGGGCGERNGGDAQSGMLTCSAGSVGVGIVGRSGKFLDALGLICGAPPVVLLPPIVVAMPPPLPPGPDPLADEVQDSAQGDGAVVVATPGPAPTTPAPPTPPAPPMPQSPPMQVGMCGPPGGMAVVVISDPNLHKLNVRASPGGAVLTAIQEGSEVSIVGECGPEAAAGFTKPPAGTSVPSGWCQIDAPVAGCVSAKFLAFGGQAAGLAKEAPPAPAAAAPTFTGSWDANAQDVAYTMTLTQTAKSVSGSYEGADGSVGKITGKVKGNVLRFAWTQTDGISGSGKFALAEDGQSFAGSYTLGSNPDQADGSWSGLRR
jgi:hypothetical protein